MKNDEMVLGLGEKGGGQADRQIERKRHTVGVEEKKAPLVQAVAEGIDGLGGGLVPLLELRHRHRPPADRTCTQLIHKSLVN